MRLVSRLCVGGAQRNSYGAKWGGIVGVIGGQGRPRLSADSTAIANCRLRLPGSAQVVKARALSHEVARPKLNAAFA